MPGASCGAPSPGSGKVDPSSWDAQRLRRWVGMAKRPRSCPYSDVAAIRPPDGLQGALQVLAVRLWDEGPQPQLLELTAVRIELPRMHGERVD